jgi:gamma-glutamylaminecyclotransferase
MANSQFGKSSVTTPQTHRVFVYGTLKRGHSNHALLATSRFLGEAATLQTYWMITTGVFPVVLDAVPADFGLPPLAIAGEIYRVDDATLKDLDRLEREGRSYDRKVTDVYEVADVSKGRRKVQAHIYVGVADYWHDRQLPAWTIQNTRRELEWTPSG